MDDVEIEKGFFLIHSSPFFSDFLYCKWINLYMLVSNLFLFLQFINHPWSQPINFGRFIGLYFGMLMITKCPGCECFHDGPLGAG